MRQSIASIALIRREAESQTLWLAQWNVGWKSFSFVGGHKRAMMLGMDERTHKKLGPPPAWADCLMPMALPARDYFRQLHCTLPGETPMATARCACLSMQWSGRSIPIPRL